MAANARAQQAGSAGVWPCGCLPLALAGLTLWASVAFLGGRWTVAVATLVMVSAVVLRWRWRRWFPHRATRELNKVIGRARLNGDARVIRRKCRRDGHQWTIAWKAPTGVTTSALTNVAEVLEVALDCSAEFWYERGLIWMRAGTAQLPREIGFSEFYDQHQPPAGELVYGIGYGRTGPVWVDLAKIPHKLVGGTPGSGKSVFLRQVLVRLALDHEPAALQMLLIDLKGGMEFFLFRGLPHLLVPVVSDLPHLAPAMETVLAELDRRMGMFAEAGVVSLEHWNERHPAVQLPYIVVAVDEYGELSLPGAESASGEGRAPRGTKAAHAAFSRIARLGRACGIHLIACTQRPDNDVMPGQVKAQLPATVAFKTRGEVNSHILLGDRNDAASRLAPYKGRAIFQWETEDEVQAPMLGPEHAAELLAAKYGQLVGHARVTQCPTRRQDDGAVEEAA